MNCLLESWVNETARVWERLISESIDAGTDECRASVVVVQALTHADGHREQFRAALAALDVEPPDLQAWTDALETGRASIHQ